MCVASVPRYECTHHCLSETMWVYCAVRIPKEQQKGPTALMVDPGAWDERRCEAPQISSWDAMGDCPGCKGMAVSRLAGQGTMYDGPAMVDDEG